MINAFNVLYSVISLLIIASLVFWLYRQYVLDSFRQRMFALRDEFFDEARSGAISYSSPAYGMLRSTMNGILRFGHRLNIPLTISLIAISSKNGINTKSFSARLEENTKNLTQEQKGLIYGYHIKMNFLVLEYLIYSSPLLLATVIFPVGFAIQAKKHINKLLSVARRPLDRIDTMALVSAET